MSEEEKEIAHPPLLEEDIEEWDSMLSNALAYWGLKKVEGRKTPFTDDNEVARPPLQGEYIESIDDLHLRLGKALERFFDNFKGSVYEHKEDGDDPLA